MHFCSMLQLPASTMQPLCTPPASLWINGSTAHPWGKGWLGCFVLRGRRNHPEVPCSCSLRDAWIRLGMGFTPRNESAWETVAVCATWKLSWKHLWSFPCATTGSPLRPCPGTDFSSWDYFHTFPTETASLST